MMLSAFNCCVSVIGCCGKCCSCCVVVFLSAEFNLQMQQNSD